MDQLVNVASDLMNSYCSTHLQFKALDGKFLLVAQGLFKNVCQKAVKPGYTRLPQPLLRAAIIQSRCL